MNLRSKLPVIANNALRRVPAIFVWVTLLLILTASAYAQVSPWETSALKLQQAFTGPIAKALSLVAIVVGGLTMAFSESGNKRVLAGLLFGVGMAMGAVAFVGWLFG